MAHYGTDGSAKAYSKRFQVRMDRAVLAECANAEDWDTVERREFNGGHPHPAVGGRHGWAFREAIGRGYSLAEANEFAAQFADELVEELTARRRGEETEEARAAKPEATPMTVAQFAALGYGA